MNNTELPADFPDAASTAPLTLDDIYTARIFEPTRLQQPHWMKDSLRFSFVDALPGTETKTIWVYDTATGERRIVIPGKALETRDEALAEKSDGAPEATGDGTAPRPIPISGYQWSPDERRILIANLPARRASQGDAALRVFEIESGSLKRVTPPGYEFRNAKWSPDGRAIGYVRQDDLYLLDLESGIETRLTDTARPHVYNGRLGWVYEEELGLADGWAWSPDGRHIAYYQQDETLVPQIDLPNYDNLHMTPRQTRYPKAGDPNPTARIGVLDVPANKGTGPVPPTRWIDTGADPDVYIARMQWTPDNRLLLQRIPRLQNRIDLLLADPETGASAVILREEDAAWVDLPGDLVFIEGAGQFLWPSDRSGWRHFYLYNLSGALQGAVTCGEWDVEQSAAIDPARRAVYFSAARPNPMERQLYCASLEGGGITQVSTRRGVHTVLFSPDASLYLDTLSDKNRPPEVTLRRAGGAKLAEVLANPMPKLEGRRLAEWRFETFETADGAALNCALLLPTDFDAARRYPVLMHTYGGPGSQVVLDSYGSGGGLEQWLAQQGVVVAMVDGRGSGMRGREFKKVVCGRLGDYEVADQIEGARWLAGLPYIDPARIGIWGWSYGGYMASLCILRGADVFRLAVAVAPVTHWTLYDSIYTERYMRRPTDNPEGYAATSPLTLTDRLKGKFLLVHGAADDNVHFQNTARLASELQKRNLPFQTMFYPGKHHGIEGVSLHVFTLITTFIQENL